MAEISKAYPLEAGYKNLCSTDENLKKSKGFQPSFRQGVAGSTRADEKFAANRRTRSQLAGATADWTCTDSFSGAAALAATATTASALIFLM